MAIFTDFVAGRYFGDYDSVSMGMTRNGFALNLSVNVEQIADSDLGGESLLDMIYQGGNCTIQAECKEYKTGSLTPFWPWCGAVTGLGGSSANGLGRAFSAGTGTSPYPVGRLASDLAKVLLLTAAVSTPAAGASPGSTGRPNTLTATYAILAPGSNAQLMLNPKLRHVPIFLQLLPYPSAVDSNTNIYRHFSTAA